MNKVTLEEVRQEVINAINAWVSAPEEQLENVDIKSKIKLVLQTICDAYMKLGIYDPNQERADLEEKDFSVLQEDNQNQYTVNMDGLLVRDINPKCEQFLIDELQDILNHIKWIGIIKLNLLKLNFI